MPDEDRASKSQGGETGSPLNACGDDMCNASLCLEGVLLARDRDGGAYTEESINRANSKIDEVSQFHTIHCIANSFFRWL
jgi:hypothetical protein